MTGVFNRRDVMNALHSVMEKGNRLLKIQGEINHSGNLIVQKNVYNRRRKS